MVFDDTAPFRILVEAFGMDSAPLWGFPSNFRHTGCEGFECRWSQLPFHLTDFTQRVPKNEDLCSFLDL